MKKNKLFGLSIAFSILMLLTCNAQAGVATDRIKSATDKLIEILNNQELNPPEMEEKRALMIRETVDTIFDWAAFSQRALGRHWRKLKKEEKKEFIPLFAKLIERTYIDKTREYSNQKMNFISEEIDGRYGVVHAEITMKNEANIAIKFSVIKRKKTWHIYDVKIKSFSLVNNYRTQFNDILTKSNYGELVNRLKKKLEE